MKFIINWGEIENHYQHYREKMISLLLTLACGDKNEESLLVGDTDPDIDSDIDSDTDTGDMMGDCDGNNAATYEFCNEMAYSTVSNDGQIFRHILISELTGWIGELTTNVDNTSYAPGDTQTVLDDIGFYFNFDYGTSSESTFSGWDATAALQTKYSDISSSGKTLQKKIAGEDDKTDHKDWKDGTSFKGWSSYSPNATVSPEGLLNEWWSVLATQVVARVGEDTSLDSVYVTPEGLDIKQLTQKFLLGAITFQQGADDYLDDGNAIDSTASDYGKGLSADHIDTSDGYTALEHAWDEGFGYFGASRDYKVISDSAASCSDSTYTDEATCEAANENWTTGDEKIESSSYHSDIDGDGLINLKKEKQWGNSINAAKRDASSAGNASPTNFTNDAITAFLDGRKFLHDTRGTALTTAQMDQLKGYRDAAVEAWEKAIAATVVHYINDTYGDMDKFDTGLCSDGTSTDETACFAESETWTADYSFTTHAKHWGELKGFALGLQFNLNSLLGDTEFEEFHTKVGDAPVLKTATATEIADYKTALGAARTILEMAYSFDSTNVAEWK